MDETTGPRKPERDGAAGTPPPRYDSEIDFRTILRFGVGLGIVIAAVLAGTWMLTSAFRTRSVARDPAPSPLAEARAHRPPPEPRLQPSPRWDLAAMRAEESARMRGYAWVDRTAGIARIPVDRAVEILLEKGLPLVTAPPPGAPAASSSAEPPPVAGAAAAAPHAPDARSAAPPASRLPRRKRHAG